MSEQASPVSEGAGTTPEPQAPFLRIEQKDVTPEEVAALVAVFGALAAGQDDPNPPPSPSWAAPHRKITPPVQHGPGGWRASGLPS